VERSQRSAGRIRSAEADQGDLPGARLSRKVVRKVLRSKATRVPHTRERQPLPKIGPWRDEIDAPVARQRRQGPREPADADRCSKRCAALDMTAARRGPAVRQAWRKGPRAADGGSLCAVELAPGEAYQFDWSHEAC